MSLEVLELKAGRLRFAAAKPSLAFFSWAASLALVLALLAPTMEEARTHPSNDNNDNDDNNRKRVGDAAAAAPSTHTTIAFAPGGVEQRTTTTSPTSPLALANSPPPPPLPPSQQLLQQPPPLNDEAPNDDGPATDEERRRVEQAEREGERRMAQYDVGQAVGRGGYAVVYKGTRKSDSLPVAVKKVEIFNLTERKRARCLGEVELLRSLTHPHIIRLEESFVFDNTLVIVTEWANNGDLRRLIRKAQSRGRPLDEPLVWRYFSQVAEALAFMHRNRTMHRDLKPANVLVSKGVLKLADLGLGRHFGPETQEAFSKVGTPYYVSPEVVRGTGYDWKSDIWSLGALLYELATLHSPFELPEDQKEAAAKANEEAAPGAKGAGLYAVFRRICAGSYDPLPADEHSPALRRLVGLMLKVEAAARPDAEQVLSFAQAAVESAAVGNTARDAALISEHAVTNVTLLAETGVAQMSRAVENMIANGRLHPLTFAYAPPGRHADSDVERRTLADFFAVCAFLLRALGKSDAELEAVASDLVVPGADVPRERRLEACQRVRDEAESVVRDSGGLKKAGKGQSGADADVSLERQNVPPSSAVTALLKGYGPAPAGVVAALSSVVVEKLHPKPPQPTTPAVEPAIPVVDVWDDEANVFSLVSSTAPPIPDEEAIDGDEEDGEADYVAHAEETDEDPMLNPILPSVDPDAWRSETTSLANRGAFTVTVQVDGAGFAPAQARAAELRHDIWEGLQDTAPRLAAATSVMSDEIDVSLSAITARESRVNGVGATPDAAVRSLKSRAQEANAQLNQAREALAHAESRVQSKAIELVRVEEAHRQVAERVEEAGACVKDPELGRQRYIHPMKLTMEDMRREMRVMDLTIERYRGELLRSGSSLAHLTKDLAEDEEEDDD